MKRKMKLAKLISLILAGILGVFLVFGFSACSSNAEDDDEKEEEENSGKLNLIEITGTIVTSNYYYESSGASGTTSSSDDDDSSSSVDYSESAFYNSSTKTPVTVNSFYLADTELTYTQWYEVYQWATSSERGDAIYTFANAGREGSAGTDGAAPSNRQPVTSISWLDALVWCNAASEKEGLSPVYYYNNEVLRDTDGIDVKSIVVDSTANGNRLPTETEWEFAARGGNPNSKEWAYTWAGANSVSELKKYAVCYTGDYGGNTEYDHNSTENIKTKKPNSIKLYDMSGNVQEFCYDIYSDNSFYRASRGGSYRQLYSNVMVISRSFNEISSISNIVGFRIARNSTSATYTVTFNANGGEITTSSQSSQLTSVSLKTANALGLSRLGYTFKGWASSADATSAEMEDGAIITLTESITLYAVWEANPSYTVTFDPNGGTITATTQSIVSKVPTALTSANTLELSREGFSFAGWAKSASATAVTIEDGSEITITGDTTLYAVWSYTATYTITYNANGGSISTSTQQVSAETITGSIEATLEYASTLEIARPGYTFKGWAKSEEMAASEVEIGNGGTITISSDTTLYAVWAYNATYTITFDANSGSISKTSQTVSGETIDGSLTDTLKTASALGCSRSGYKFGGWSTNSSASSASYSNGGTITLKSDITLYALWYIPTCTISFYALKTGTWSTGTYQVVHTEIINEGSTYTIPSASDVGITASGYTFKGWATSQRNTTKYTAGDTVTVTSDMSLYPVWQENCIYVRLYNDTGSAITSSNFAVFVAGNSSNNAVTITSLASGRYSSSYTKFSLSSSGSAPWAVSYGGGATTKAGTLNFAVGSYYTIKPKAGTCVKDK